ncbi:hypothetical protein HK101_010772 [Irineochytrium annulatum]|nr:hypothetical protein HK101_010772 [Irineochytrium annulatum]
MSDNEHLLKRIFELEHQLARKEADIDAKDAQLHEAGSMGQQLVAYNEQLSVEANSLRAVVAAHLDAERVESINGSLASKFLPLLPLDAVMDDRDDRTSSPSPSPVSTPCPKPAKDLGFSSPSNISSPLSAGAAASRLRRRQLQHDPSRRESPLARTQHRALSEGSDPTPSPTGALQRTSSPCLLRRRQEPESDDTPDSLPSAGSRSAHRPSPRRAGGRAQKSGASSSSDDRDGSASSGSEPGPLPKRPHAPPPRRVSELSEHGERMIAEQGVRIEEQQARIEELTEELRKRGREAAALRKANQALEVGQLKMEERLAAADAARSAAFAAVKGKAGSARRERTDSEGSEGDGANVRGMREQIEILEREKDAMEQSFKREVERGIASCKRAYDEKEAALAAELREHALRAQDVERMQAHIVELGGMLEEERAAKANLEMALANAGVSVAAPLSPEIMPGVPGYMMGATITVEVGVQTDWTVVKMEDVVEGDIEYKTEEGEEEVVVKREEDVEAPTIHSVIEAAINAAPGLRSSIGLRGVVEERTVPSPPGSVSGSDSHIVHATSTRASTSANNAFFKMGSAGGLLGLVRSTADDVDFEVPDVVHSVSPRLSSVDRTPPRAEMRQSDNREIALSSSPVRRFVPGNNTTTASMMMMAPTPWKRTPTLAPGSIISALVSPPRAAFGGVASRSQPDFKIFGYTEGFREDERRTRASAVIRNSVLKEESSAAEAIYQTAPGQIGSKGDKWITDARSATVMIKSHDQKNDFQEKEPKVEEVATEEENASIEEGNLTKAREEFVSNSVSAALAHRPAQTALDAKVDDTIFKSDGKDSLAKTGIRDVDTDRIATPVAIRVTPPVNKSEPEDDEDEFVSARASPTESSGAASPTSRRSLTDLWKYFASEATRQERQGSVSLGGAEDDRAMLHFTAGCVRVLDRSLGADRVEIGELEDMAVGSLRRFLEHIIAVIYEFLGYH